MIATKLLVVYSLLTIVAAIGGGLFPLVVRLTHRGMQIAISFVSGVILGIGLLHLLPHSFGVLESIDRTVLWVLAGFLFMFFLERFFSFHHHDVADDAMHAEHDDAHPPHDHVHDGHVPHEHAAGSSNLSWSGAAIGLSLHGLIDGIAIAVAVQAELLEGPARWAGIGTALAVALHKPFDALTIGALMAAARQTRRQRFIANLLYSLVTPLGMLAVFLIGGSLEQSLGQALGFAAGAFVCIATSDLLPELHFHRHDRIVLSAALLAGIALAWGTVLLEERGHDDQHGTRHEIRAARLIAP